MTIDCDISEPLGRGFCCPHLLSFALWLWSAGPSIPRDLEWFKWMGDPSAHAPFTTSTIWKQPYVFTDGWIDKDVVQDFPGGPVVKNPGLHCIWSLVGELRSCTWCSQNIFSTYIHKGMLLSREKWNLQQHGCTWRALREGERSQTETNTVWFCLYVESEKYNQLGNMTSEADSRV